MLELRPLSPACHQDAARLIHKSLATWYERNLRQGHRFGETSEPFRLFPDLYASLDPHEALAAYDPPGQLRGICFVHPRRTHIAVGILATDPELAGRGVARALMEKVLERARAESKPVRLVSSLLNLDSFSLYSRLGFVPHTLYQDISIAVPDCGILAPQPPFSGAIREAREADIGSIADLEYAMNGIHRPEDYIFFLSNRVGNWRIWVSESAGGLIEGALVVSHHPDWGMLGPGIAQDAQTAKALLWHALHTRRNQTSVVLVPCRETDLVHALYAWGGRNIELHAAQSTPEAPPAKGILFPTFLPESA